MSQLPHVTATRDADDAVAGLKAGLWFPLFDELADPRVCMALAVEAEEAGWDGVFVWDHVRWRPPVASVGDPWVTLAAMAAVTSSVQLGPMVSPLARRRPVKVARETASLDVLSGGRLVLGVGLGSDRFGEEFSRTGEHVDDRVRASQLDESLAILQGAWSGEPVRHRGEHYVVDDVQFLPRPVSGRVPVWVAAFPGNRRPIRRAARYDGLFPVNVTSADQLAEQVALLRAEGGPVPTTGVFDVAVALPAGADLSAHRKAGATWWLTDFDADTASLDSVRGVLRDGPAR